MSSTQSHLAARRRVAAPFAAIVVAAALLPAAASAHVTLQPKTAAEGSYSVLSVRVPTERDTASTVKVQVQLPPGFSYAAYEPTPGWTVKVKKSKLATPIKTDDGDVTEEVDEITWTGTGKGDGKIAPGQFKDFPLSLAIPGKAGDTLTFKAIQTYSDKSVVRWIGAPDADKPAPTVAVIPAADAAHGAPAAAPAATPATPAVPSVPEAKAGASKGLGIAALAVGIVALLLGAGAIVIGRSKTA
jgi:uncharacterized protein